MEKRTYALVELNLRDVESYLRTIAMQNHAHNDEICNISRCPRSEKHSVPNRDHMHQEFFTGSLSLFWDFYMETGRTASYGGSYCSMVGQNLFYKLTPEKSPMGNYSNGCCKYLDNL